MKIKKYKNGTIKMTAENKRDSNNLLAFLGGCAGTDSNFAKMSDERNKCPHCGSRNIKMHNFENNSCNECNAIFNVLTIDHGNASTV